MAESWQHEEVDASRAKRLGEGVPTTPPAPTSVALQHALNPLPQLFTTFPAPSFTYTVPLTCARADAGQQLARIGSADSCVEEAATASATSVSQHLSEEAWRPDEIDRLVEQMHTSAASLLQAGSFSHLLEEQLLKECGGEVAGTGPINTGRHSADLSAATASGSADGVAARASGPASAAEMAQAKMKPVAQRLLSQLAQGASLDRPGSATTTTTTTSSVNAAHTSDRVPQLNVKSTTLGSSGALPASYMVSHIRPGPSTLASAPSSRDGQWARSPDAHMQLRPRRSTTTVTSASNSQGEETADDVPSRERSRSGTVPMGRGNSSRPTVKRMRSEDEVLDTPNAAHHQPHRQDGSRASLAQTGNNKEPSLKSSLEDLPQACTSDAPDNPLAVLLASAPSAKVKSEEAKANTGHTLYPVEALRRVVQVLPLQSNPFQALAQADVTHLLSQLLDDTVIARAITVPLSAPPPIGAAAAHKTRKSHKKNKAELHVKPEPADEADSGTAAASPHVGPDAEELMATALRGLCCCVCASHPTFPAEAAPEDLVDRALTALSVVMRAVTRALSEAAGEAQEAVEAADEKPLSRPRRAAPAGATGCSGAHRNLIAWLEILRAYLKHLGIVVCRRGVRLATDTDLVRLEDVCVQTMFVIPHRCEKPMLPTYTSYAMDGAVQLFRSVWNHLSAQRTSLAEAFFSVLPLSEALRVRSCAGPTGAKVMPLSLAVLAAAQSMPAPDKAESAEVLVRRQQQQCQFWVGLIIQKLLVEHMESPKAEVDVALAVTVQMAEDLTELLACPEWPAADTLLRALVLGLAHTCLSSGGADPSPAGVAEAHWLRPLAVDVVAHVALKLYDSAGPFRTVHRVANSYLPSSSSSLAQANSVGSAGLSAENPMHNSHRALEAMAASLVAEARGDDALFTEWLRAVNIGVDATPTPRGRSSVRRPAATDGMNSTHTPPPTLKDTLLPVEQLQALAYGAFSRHAEQARHTRPDVSSAWWHARAAQLLSWQQLSQGTGDSSASNSDTPTPPPLPGQGLGLPDAALHTLLLAEAPPRAGVEVSSTQLRWWLLVLSTGLDKSMTSRKMGQTLLSLLLSVFQLKDARGHELEMSDTVVRKVLVSLSSLTALYPPLHRVIWHMARRCVQDSSARVRESMVPLLLTVLTTILQSTSAGHASPGQRDCPTEGLGLSDESMDTVADIISSLLHLLEDRSITVVSRTIAALETILIEPPYRPLLATPKGAVLLAFAEYKLLALVSDGAEAKHRAEVTRLFLRRWILVLPEEDGAALTATTGTAHAQFAKELMALTTRCVPEFPYEVCSSVPVVQLLNRMLAEVRTQRASARRRTRHTVSEEQLQLVMRGTVRTLWGRYQAATKAEDAVSALAAVHALALVSGEWLESLLDVLVQALDYPPAKSTSTAASLTPSSTHASSELTGGTLLQVCLIWRTLLSSSHVPGISLDRLSRAVTVLLSKYVGPYQQRLILAACGTLTTMITCGAADKLTPQHIQRPYLVLCYTLMNTYYVRVRTLLPSISKDPQNIAYIQRFLFLLSEFVRLYPGWRHADASELTDEAVASSSGSAASSMPNQLVKGNGICQNVYQLAQDVLAACHDPATRARVAVIALRVLASVCILDPSEYLYRCEPQLREALRPEADPALQAQGLTLIRDFLGDEDARVEMAARQTTNAFAARRQGQPGRQESEDDTAAMVAAALDDQADDDRADTRSSDLEESAQNPQVRTRRARDQNSGMATWILQRFHESVLDLCGSQHVHIRALCLDVLQWTAQGGLLPPVKYLEALVALSADSVPSIGQRARACLQTHADRHEEAIAAHASYGVLRAYRLHYACGLHLVRSALSPTDSAAPTTSSGGRVNVADVLEVSAHGPLFSLLRKRHRDTLLISLLRYFYQDSKASHWCEQHGVMAPPPPQTSTVPSSEVGFYTLSLVSLLAHLAVAITFLPFANEGDAVQVLQQCRTGIDLVGQSALDTVNAVLHRATSPATRGEVSEAEVDLAVGLWRAVGVVALQAVRQALTSEYRLTAQRLQRYAHSQNTGTAGHHAPSLPCRRPGSPAMTHFLSNIAALVRAATPCARWVAEATRTHTTSHLLPDDALTGFQFLHQALETALLVDKTTAEDDIEAFVASGLAEGDAGRRGKRRRAVAVPPAKERTRTTTGASRRRRRRREESDSSDDDDSDDAIPEEEEPSVDGINTDDADDEADADAY